MPDALRAPSCATVLRLAMEGMYASWLGEDFTGAGSLDGGGVLVLTGPGSLVANGLMWRGYGMLIRGAVGLKTVFRLSVRIFKYVAGTNPVLPLTSAVHQS